MSEKQMNIPESFDAFTGDYLKPEDVKSKSDPYVCIGVDVDDYEGKKKLRIELERNKVRKYFTFNVTNIKILQGFKNISQPKDLIGKIIYFDKMKVNNPSTQKPQDSLIIDSVEVELKA